MGQTRTLLFFWQRVSKPLSELELPKTNLAQECANHWKHKGQKSIAFAKSPQTAGNKPILFAESAKNARRERAGALRPNEAGTIMTEDNTRREHHAQRLVARRNDSVDFERAGDGAGAAAEIVANDKAHGVFARRKFQSAVVQHTLVANYF
jgi:hypothetical protein